MCMKNNRTDSKISTIFITSAGVVLLIFFALFLYPSEKYMPVSPKTPLSKCEPSDTIPDNSIMIDSATASFILQKWFDDNITLLKNENHLLPLQRFSNFKMLNIIIGDTTNQQTIKTIWDCYAPPVVYHLPSKPDYQEIENTHTLISSYDYIFFHIVPDFSVVPIKQQIFDLIEQIGPHKKIVVVCYGTEHTAEKLIISNKTDAVIMAHKNTPEAYHASIRGIFGSIGFSQNFVATVQSFPTQKTRIDYSSSLNAGIHPDSFLKIDTMVADAINSKTFPGCQVTAIWKGQVIFEKSYGYHTYKNQRAVKNSDLYDLASLTKILATTVALMNLSANGAIDIDKTIGDYLPAAKDSNKSNITIKRVLSHNAKLIPWIPFYRTTLHNGYPDSLLYSTIDTGDFLIQVTDSLWLKNTYPDSMMQEIFNSPLLRKASYRYSDLGFIMLKEIIEQVTNTPFEEFLIDSVYGPLNLTNICFNPLQTNHLTSIVPTEDDRYFRQTLLQGYVHDMAAAMFGGVAGHAGLFSNARDIGILMYTLINNGSYGNTAVLDADQIEIFNKRHYYGNRRGLGFDKPVKGRKKQSNVSSDASDSSFGHSGFTGTYTWADPENELVFVFLSNRVHPDGQNRQISTTAIRQKIHSHIYHVISTAGTN